MKRRPSGSGGVLGSRGEAAETILIGRGGRTGENQ